MVTYKELYIHLFAAAEDALEALEQGNYGQARDRLIAAQRAAEDRILDGAEDETAPGVPEAENQA